MGVAFVGFDWDEGNRGKCQQHGVPTEVIEALFQGPVAVFPDPAHSHDETRFKAIGTTVDGRGVLLVFTLRTRDDETYLRPISARYMHRKEVEYYEKAITRAEK